ncbi:RNA 3'-terminal phosphate cyclase [Gemmata obscuriglobus]|nr:RNA 3'-terminal phosphate cyclase [Gemmata obscuriglobus]QEG30393.1 RNA 3'-terminal phosphate cyclase [Gemmata obscuriglobus]VTS09717.1 rna 3 -phosphate cyclase : RNA 3''-phosphate cyclase OS=Singulisphaera acidiphila (strain ATCC BAA-1392 / DSM 18658 / VKM B-2454 / MOB10) GN=Sinac_0456 PE=4 SV=1: RTC: RTC_insert [Gemmata obscuriglobus UQM 2246]
MIEIDGSEGEGGGQILRSSLALSVLTGRPFKLTNIRANRSKPGLQPQHVMCVKAAGAVSGAQYKGAANGSSVLYFEPGAVKAGRYTFTIGTAGATALVLHTVYLPLALRGDKPSEVTVTGGTHNAHAPCYHFLETTWAAYLARLGIKVELELVRPGFYPRGGGEIRAVIHPCSRVNGLSLLTCPELTTAGGFSAYADLPESVGKKQARRLSVRLKSEGVESHLPVEQWEAASPGSVAAVIFRQAPVPPLFFGLGERGKPAESVADDAADEAIAFRDAKCPVDPHSADQLLLPLALSGDASEYRTSEVTRHLTTNVETVRKFVDRTITIEHGDAKSGIVRIAARV